MNKSSFFIVVLLASVFLSYCSKSIEEMQDSDQTLKSISSLSTRATRLYVVDENDINCYIEFKRLISKEPGLVVKSIDLFGGVDNRKAYIINFGDSWELISPDKRTPPVLAEGPGTFRREDTNPAAIEWMEGMVSSILSISESDNMTEQQRQCLQFWRLIGCDVDESETRIVLPFPPPWGYHLVSVDSTMDYYDAIPHLITTKWGQGSPYNLYCPLKYGTVSERAPAGCVAVAGAQMLMFLQQNFDVPETAPDTASCQGFAYSSWYHYINYQQYDPVPYQMNQWRFRSHSWTRMQNGDSLAISAFIANVGTEAELIYCGDKTVGTLFDLNANVFANSYYIGSSFDSYDESTVIAQLQDGMPSIVGGAAGTQYAHVFIIDRYRYSQMRYIFTYEENNPEPSNVPLSKRIITYSTPFLSHFGMNWGWAGNHDDDWYLIDGTWNPLDVNYAFNREMINFENDYGQD